VSIAVAVLIGMLGYAIAARKNLWHRVAPNPFLAELLASAIRFTFVVAGIVLALDIVGATALLGAVLGGAGCSASRWALRSRTPSTTTFRR
jgi:hypothetical protein